MSDRKPPAFFAPLEGMRGVAALGVVLFHVYNHWHIVDLGIVRNAQLFVDLFFVISGFVIAHIYIPRLRDWPQLLEFAVLRTARLYPLHLFTLLVAAIYLLAMHQAGAVWDLPAAVSRNPVYAQSTLRHLIENLLMLQWHDGSFNKPSWSIGTEYYTYFIFALSVFLVRSRPRLLALTFAAFAALTLAALLWEGDLVLGRMRFLRCVCGFSIGVLVYLAWQRGCARMARWLGDGWRLQLAEAAVAVLTVTIMGCCGPDRTAFLVLPAFALSVFTFAQGRGWVARGFEHPLVQRLGRWSYSIYMVHFIIILMINDAAWLLFQDGPRTFAQWPVWGGALLTLALVALVLATASLSYRWIEAPPRRWAKRWVAGSRGRYGRDGEDELAGAP